MKDNYKSVEYSLHIKLIDNTEFDYKWVGFPQSMLKPGSRILAPHGVNFENKAGRVICIPWHQIKKASYTEKNLNDNGLE